MNTVDARTWELLMQRFDRIEEQNKEQINLISSHVKDDRKVSDTVGRHGVYFKILGGGAGTVLALLAAKMGWK